MMVNAENYGTGFLGNPGKGIHDAAGFRRVVPVTNIESSQHGIDNNEPEGIAEPGLHRLGDVEGSGDELGPSFFYQKVRRL